MPGFTPISMFPKCWLATGMSYPDLITELIDSGRAASAPAKSSSPSCSALVHSPVRRTSARAPPV